ncbi:lipoprotein 17-related variable surface protein [[Mycoplasma] testudinis]|uniref:lipoprotein 17-related variable surface protein n=1 Tax=[Mycoplasma] testudinis TaxID=33924 RepID=UPI00048539C1|nr:lipoprotein 17-related variable surface protein [[Mycoplasma] testudinis]
MANIKWSRKRKIITLLSPLLAAVPIIVGACSAPSVSFQTSPDNNKSNEKQVSPGGTQKDVAKDSSKDKASDQTSAPKPIQDTPYKPDTTPGTKPSHGASDKTPNTDPSQKPGTAPNTNPTPDTSDKNPPTQPVVDNSRIIAAYYQSLKDAIAKTENSNKLPSELNLPSNPSVEEVNNLTQSVSVPSLPNSLKDYKLVISSNFDNAFGTISIYVTVANLDESSLYDVNGNVEDNQSKVGKLITIQGFQTKAQRQTQNAIKDYYQSLTNVIAVGKTNVLPQTLVDQINDLTSVSEINQLLGIDSGAVQVPNTNKLPGFGLKFEATANSDGTLSLNVVLTKDGQYYDVNGLITNDQAAGKQIIIGGFLTQQEANNQAAIQTYYKDFAKEVNYTTTDTAKLPSEVLTNLNKSTEVSTLNEHLTNSTQIPLLTNLDSTKFKLEFSASANDLLGILSTRVFITNADGSIIYGLDGLPSTNANSGVAINITGFTNIVKNFYAGVESGISADNTQLPSQVQGIIGTVSDVDSFNNLLRPSTNLPKLPDGFSLNIQVLSFDDTTGSIQLGISLVADGKSIGIDGQVLVDGATGKQITFTGLKNNRLEKLTQGVNALNGIFNTSKGVIQQQVVNSAINGWHTRQGRAWSFSYLLGQKYTNVFGTTLRDNDVRDALNKVFSSNSSVSIANGISFQYQYNLTNAMLYGTSVHQSSDGVVTASIDFTISQADANKNLSNNNISVNVNYKIQSSSGYYWSDLIRTVSKTQNLTIDISKFATDTSYQNSIKDQLVNNLNQLLLVQF